MVIKVEFIVIGMEHIKHRRDGMIKSIIGTILTFECPVCHVASTYDVSGITIEFSEEFNEYLMLDLPCSCGSITSVNLNIPVDESEENLDLDDIETEDEITRFYTRLLQRMIRADFKEEGN